MSLLYYFNPTFISHNLMASHKMLYYWNCDIGLYIYVVAQCFDYCLVLLGLFGIILCYFYVLFGSCTLIVWTRTYSLM